MLAIKERLFEFLRISRSKINRLRMQESQRKLAQQKAQQKTAFDSLSVSFDEKYQQLKKYHLDRYTTPLWKKYNAKLEKILLPHPPFSFLQDPMMMMTMFDTAGGHWLKKELTFLEKKIAKRRLKLLLKEDYVGDPLLLQAAYLTSHTTIRHLYHLVKFLDVSGCNLTKIKTVIEWGGGYGNLVKILKRLLIKPCTYIIIDTPLLSCLQWLYLSTIFGKEAVHLLSDEKGAIKINKINILPVSLLAKYPIRGDLFISTWALSESSKYSQDYVVKHNWFQAKHLLLAYQENETGLFDPVRVGKLAADRGAVIQKVEFLPGNHYAFL